MIKPTRFLYCGENEIQAWGVCKILRNKIIQQYIQDPTNIAAYEKAAKGLYVPSMQDINVIINLSFYISYKRIAKETGDLKLGKYNLIGKMCNQIIACFQFRTDLVFCRFSRT